MLSVRLASSCSPAVRRVLCLHGKGNSALSFRATLAPLIQAADGRIEWLIPDAPYPLVGHTGSAWWDLPVGARSFDTSEFIGAHASIAALEDMYPIDGVIGFSQGAILASVLLLRGLQGLAPGYPKRAVLCGAAMPGPYVGAVNALTPELIRSAGVKSLHVVGTTDRVNPPELARHLCEALCGRLVEHADAHVMRMDEPFVRHYLDLLLCE